MLYDLIDNLEMYLDEYKVPVVMTIVTAIITSLYFLSH